MKTTSHFVGINIKPAMFSDIFVEAYKYIKDQGIEDAVSLQNPLTPHMTLYYFEKDLSEDDKNNIKNDISHFDITQPMYLTGLDYFLRDENRFVLYFRTATNIPLKKYRDELHTSYNRIDIINNSFEFSPHMTFLRIQDSEVFEIYRNNLEKIILQDLSKLKKINISKGEVSLYAVNSEYKEEIQIAI